MNKNTSKNGEVHLLDLLIILAKHSRLIILVSAAVTILTYLVLVILPNKFMATARLLPPQQNLTLSGQLMEILGGSVSPGSNTSAGSVGNMAASLLGFKSPSEVWVSMMNSNTIRDSIIDRFNLMNLFKTKYIEDARKKLNKFAKISAGNKDGIIVIEVTSTTPKLAADIANAFIEELEKLIQRLANQEAKGRLAFLEKERLQASQNLVKAEEAVRRFSEKNSVLQIDAQTRGVLEYIARLRAEIDSKEVSIQVLRQQATPFNYDVVRKETEIKGLKEKLQTVECKYDNNLTDACLTTNKTPGLALDYIRLYREAKFQESLYQLYIKLAEVARMDIAREIAVIQVIDIAKPPQKKSNSRLFPSIIIGISTFIIMIFAAFGLEYMQNIKSNEDNFQHFSILKNYLKPWRKILHK